MSELYHKSFQFTYHMFLISMDFVEFMNQLIWRSRSREYEERYLLECNLMWSAVNNSTFRRNMWHASSASKNTTSKKQHETGSKQSCPANMQKQTSSWTEVTIDVSITWRTRSLNCVTCDPFRTKDSIYGPTVLHATSDRVTQQYNSAAL
jgi:hypothetical protein